MTQRQSVGSDPGEQHRGAVESVRRGAAEAFAMLLLTSAVVVVILVVASGFSGA